MGFEEKRKKEMGAMMLCGLLSFVFLSKGGRCFFLWNGKKGDGQEMR